MAKTIEPTLWASRSLPLAAMAFWCRALYTKVAGHGHGHAPCHSQFSADGGEKFAYERIICLVALMRDLFRENSFNPGWSYNASFYISTAIDRLTDLHTELFTIHRTPKLQGLLS